METAEAAPVAEKQPKAAPRFGVPGVTADMLSELRRKTVKVTDS